MDRIFISTGEKVFYNDKECIIIKILNISTVTIEEVQTNIIHTVRLDELKPFYPNQTIYLESLPEKDWERAKSRYEVISPILSNRGNLDLITKTAKENNISVPTIYRWLKLFDETGLVSSLAGGKKTGGIGKSRLTKNQEEIINNKINTVYLNQSRKSITKLIREIQLECDNLKITCPHPNTIRSRVKALSDEEKIRKRLGIKEARYKFEPLKGHYEDAQYPLSIIQIDHTLLDITLVDGLDRRPYKRPWLTVALDVYSRMVVGIYLSFESPGTLGTGMCVANSILPKEMWLAKHNITADWPCWGIMDTIHVDNAKEFHGNMLKKACQNYGITLQYRPVATPHWGGHIERLMGTFAREIHNLPGTTFSSVAERKQYESEKNSSFTLDELEKWLLVFITKIYHQRKHSSIGMSPIEKYKNGILGNNNILGRGISPRINDHRSTKLDFMPYFERSVQEYGIVIDHIYYYADVLRQYIHSSDKKEINKYIFKRDPRDISVVYFLEPKSNTYYDIPYRNSSYPPLSIWEYRDILRDLKDSSEQVTEEKIFEAYRELNYLEMKNRKRTIKTRNIRKDDSLVRTDVVSFESEDEEKDIIETILPFEDLDDETFIRKN
ncbi:helix-turn-helix domain-containing protein [Chryseobacterium gambrini]|uniref:DDE-type integrase/transposase/recombinase n=1 Tax=Chryseobacterium gambrini TaxID=373672 RepID=A0ABN7CI95_9FLAO|nr:DDE-type integrase/transposase/recombinase [Chryseobacterium gambrini]